MNMQEKVSEATKEAGRAAATAVGALGSPGAILSGTAAEKGKGWRTSGGSLVGNTIGALAGGALGSLTGPAGMMAGGLAGASLGGALGAWLSHGEDTPEKKKAKALVLQAEKSKSPAIAKAKIQQAKALKKTASLEYRVSKAVEEFSK